MEAGGGLLGVEWVVDALGCDPARLRDPALVRKLFDDVVGALRLKPVAPLHLHQFGGEAGITALLLLSESHLALHSFPEHGAVTVNLYSCKTREELAWPAVLREAFGATDVVVRTLSRGPT
ncbi:MAG: speH [Myxococcaceae bacterium]|nr:speH [Myxococcaceae bacterium]